MKTHWTAAGLLWPVAAALAQAPAPQASSGAAVLTARTTLVLVPALVTNKAGELVYTLTASDFTITDDGVEQKVALEEDTGGEPLALVVAIETGGAGGRRLGDYDKLGTMIEAVAGGMEHKVAVVAFDSSPKVVQGFTPEMGLVSSAVHSLTAGTDGAAIFDGLALSVAMLREQSPQYRRAILLISETVDRGSVTKLDDALRAISDTNTAIYSLAFSSSRADVRHQAAETVTPNEPGPAGGCMSQDPNAPRKPTSKRLEQAWDCLSVLAPPLRLAKMAVLAGRDGLRTNAPETVARLTGGEYFGFSNEHSLQHGLATIANHVPNRYMLSFHPQSPHPGLHAVELKLKDYPDLTVKGRSSYWADSETDAGQPALATPQP